MISHLSISEPFRDSARDIFKALIFTVILASLALSPAWAQDNETCEACHDDPDHTVIRYGVEVSLYVTSEHLADSPHADFACVDCHTELAGVDDWPHRERLVLPDCGYCHEEEQAVFVEGFFGPLMQKGYTSIPSCSDCHGQHEVSWVGHPRQVCGVCHQDVLEDFLASRHWKADEITQEVTCVSCHNPHFKMEKGQYTPHQWKMHLVESCNVCHEREVANYTDSQHFRELERGNLKAPVCSDCHARHRVLSPRDPSSLVSVARLDLPCTRCHVGYEISIHRPREGDDPRLETCVACHVGHTTDMTTVHSSIFATGLANVCLLCHEKELLADPAEAHMVIHQDKIEQARAGEPVNCGQCHQYHYQAPEHPAFTGIKRACGECHPEEQEAWEQSVHGISSAKGHEEAPTCITCHGERFIPRTEESLKGKASVELCSSCHSNREIILRFQLNPDVVSGYQSTYHGQVYQLGYQGSEFATCASCHDNHSVLSISDQRSTISEENILNTCGRCHEDVNINFVSYLQHFSPMAHKENPILQGVDTFMRWLLGVTLAIFGAHTFLWLIRLLIKRIFEGKKPTRVKSAYRVRRFNLFPRLLHLGLLLSFGTLATTGLPLKYSHTPLATWFVTHLISLGTAAILHRIAALTLASVFAFHLITVLYRWLGRGEKGLFYGARSLVPSLQDIKDFFLHLGYFIGLLRKPPKFDRWTYWEKFDYFAVFWGMIIIGASGLTLWFPETFTRLFPGWIINAAHIIHSEEALLATAFIFTVHFFNTHLRPGAFPMDEVIFTGRLTEERFEEERPLEKERLITSGEYEKIQVSPLPRWTKYLLLACAYLFLSIGFMLLIFIIIGTFFRG